jgi:DNA-binding MarR family transcriptional regulator
MVVRYNYVVPSDLGDAELDRLIVRLLRELGPASDGATLPGAPDAAPAAPDAPSRIRVPSSSEARALIELAASHGIAQGELAGLLGLEKSTVSRLAAGLERKGWVRRGRDDGDLRYVRLYLTDEGSQVATRVWRAWRCRQARLLAGLSAEERAWLASGLRGILRGLTAEGRAVAPEGAGHRPGRAATPR